MRIQEKSWQILSAVLLSGVLFLTSGCHATRTPPHHGCFDPVPAQPVQVLGEWKYQLRWPSAHRGDSQAGPENSVKAIAAAARRGLPLLEVDIRRSADGMLFLFHDHHLGYDNFAGPSQYLRKDITSLKWDEIRTLRHPGSSETFPSFAQALRAAKGYPTALELDLKGESPGLAAQAIEEALRMGMERQIVVQCQHIETARFIREHFPGIAILARCNNPIEVAAALKLQPVPEIVHIDFPWSSTSLIDEIHEAGAAVLMKTLEPGEDTAARWNALMELGVDIVMTDYPETFTRSIPRACAAK